VNELTPKSAEQEVLPPLEEEDAIPMNQRVMEGDVPSMPRELIAQNEQEYLDSMALEPAPIEESGAYQVAHMLNVSSFSAVTPEEVIADYSSGGQRLEEANRLGVEYEQSIAQEADKYTISNPNIPVEQRVESLKRLNNPLKDIADLYAPVLPRQFAQGVAHQESLRYGAGTYANGGVDAQNAITQAYAQSTTPTFGAMEWNEYVQQGQDVVATVTAPKEDSVGWLKMGEAAQTPEQIEAFIAGSAEYTEKTWKFWSTQGLAMITPLSDQYYWSKVVPVFEKNGIKPAKTSLIDPDSALGTVSDYIGAGGLTQRDYIKALQEAPPATRKKVAMDILKLYDGKSGLDVYLAGLLT